MGSRFHLASRLSNGFAWRRAQRFSIHFIFNRFLTVGTSNGSSLPLGHDGFELRPSLVLVWRHLGEQVLNKSTTICIRTWLFWPRRRRICLLATGVWKWPRRPFQLHSRYPCLKKLLLGESARPDPVFSCKRLFNLYNTNVPGMK